MRQKRLHLRPMMALNRLAFFVVEVHQVLLSKIWWEVTERKDEDLWQKVEASFIFLWCG